MGEEPTAGAPDQRAEFDAARAACPVAHEDGIWTLYGHAAVSAAARDPGTFSNAVSTHLNVPNGMDGEQHARYRKLIDRYFTPERVAEQEPQCRAAAELMVRALPRGGRVEVVRGLGAPYAVRVQSTWLGWPRELERELLEWMADNHAATRSGDRARTAEVATRFDTIIRSLIARRRRAAVMGPLDVTGQLVHDRIDGRRLTDAEIVSILRNWTAGDLGSLALCLGVVVRHLAADARLQEELRSLVRAEDADPAGECEDPRTDQLEEAIEEMLRIDDPFVSNRRVTRHATVVAGTEIPGHARLVLNWTAANRDPAVFPDPDTYDPARHAPHNLVFGAGPHVCPGRGLSLMELRVAVAELLRATAVIEPDGAEDVRATLPVGGWAAVHVILR